MWNAFLLASQSPFELVLVSSKKPVSSGLMDWYEDTLHHGNDDVCDP